MGSRFGLVTYRAVTCPLRMMPTFIVIGAHRGGTSAFYHYLTEHPSIGAATTKELNFFDKNFHKGTWWYRAHFPFPARQSVFISGEASPHYMFHPLVPQRVASIVPDVKLIALLRNPIDRAFSQYRRYVYLGRETLPFAEAIAQEEQRLGDSDHVGKDVGDDPRDVVGNSSYLARGVYADQLQRWRRVFPREQVLTLRSEDFYADPVSALKQALTFLHVPFDGLPAQTTYDRFDGYAEAATSYGVAKAAKMNPALRAHLNAYFAPHNRRLYKLLGRDMQWE